MQETERGGNRPNNSFSGLLVLWTTRSEKNSQDDRKRRGADENGGQPRGLRPSLEI